MSITSTARKATTLFLSFFLFNNVCTLEHVSGIVIFISALTAKSLRRRNDKHPTKKNKKHRHHHNRQHEHSRRRKQENIHDEMIPLTTIEMGSEQGLGDPSLLIRRTTSKEAAGHLELAEAASFDKDGGSRHHVHIV